MFFYLTGQNANGTTETRTLGQSAGATRGKISDSGDFVETHAELTEGDL